MPVATLGREQPELCLPAPEPIINPSIQRYLDQRASLPTNTKNLVILEGLIGSGKTSLLRLLASKGKHVIEENLELWNYTGTSKPGLFSTYLSTRDTSEISTFQLLVATVYFIQAANMTHHTYYQERSIYAAYKVFLPELQISDRQRMMISCFIQSLIQRMPLPKYVIYLDVPVDTCYERILSRGRPHEDITKAYLQRLHRGHRHLMAWYQSRHVPVITLRPEEITDDILYAL